MRCFRSLSIGVERLEQLCIFRAEYGVRPGHQDVYRVLNGSTRGVASILCYTLPEFSNDFVCIREDGLISECIIMTCSS
jgi:hypothetical protein